MPSMVRLMYQLKKCVEIKGDYVEKYQSHFISVTLKSCSGRKLSDPTTYALRRNGQPVYEISRNFLNRIRLGYVFAIMVQWNYFGHPFGKGRGETLVSNGLYFQ